MLFSNQWIKKKREKQKKFIETNENGNATFQNLQDTAKAVLRRNFIAINSSPKKQEKYQIQPNFSRNHKKNNKQRPKLVEERK